MIQRLFIVIAICALVVPGLGRAEDGTSLGAPDGAAIRQVIEGQLAAFRRDDAAAAFSYASPTIQQKFGTAEIFLEMVKIGYRPVYRPRQVEFRELRVEGGTIVQDVFVVGPDGHSTLALYMMQRQPDGTWKISGCVLATAPDLDV